MIQGQTTSENYFSIDRDSASSLKEFSLDRRKYKKRYIDKTKVEDDELSKAMTVGNLVDCLLLEPETFDSKFYMSSIASAPTGNMLAFCEALYKHSQNEELEFKAILHGAYKDSGYKLTFEKVLERFTGSDAEIWFNEVKQVRSKNLTVITLDDVQNAEKIVEELKTNEFTHEIINEHQGVYAQLKVDDYQIDGLDLKSMMDKCIVKYYNRTIQVADLKCVWAVENFFEEYYLYRRAYIQALLYKKAAEHYFKDIIEKGYKVLNPVFIVCDSINYYAPLIYQTSDKDLEDAYNGFEYKGKTYPGVKEIIEELKWAKENNNWRITKKNYINRGIVSLKP